MIEPLRATLPGSDVSVTIQPPLPGDRYATHQFAGTRQPHRGARAAARLANYYMSSGDREQAVRALRDGGWHTEPPDGAISRPVQAYGFNTGAGDPESSQLVPAARRQIGRFGAKSTKRLGGA